MRSSLVTHALVLLLRLGQEDHEFQNNPPLDASSKRKEKKPPNPLKIQCSGSLGPVDSVI